MSRISPYIVLVLLALLSTPEILAADYENGLAPPGAPSSAFPTPSRPVAGIVTDIWRDEESRDRAGEAENVMNLLGVNSGLVVADIGAGSGYYTISRARANQSMRTKSAGTSACAMSLKAACDEPGTRYG
jgi:hypothetical protein